VTEQGADDALCAFTLKAMNFCGSFKAWGAERGFLLPGRTSRQESIGLCGAALILFFI
jgi:hypothetical protein